MEVSNHHIEANYSLTENFAWPVKMAVVGEWQGICLWYRDPAWGSISNNLEHEEDLQDVHYVRGRVRARLLGS